MNLIKVGWWVDQKQVFQKAPNDIWLDISDKSAKTKDMSTNFPKNKFK